MEKEKLIEVTQYRSDQRLSAHINRDPNKQVPDEPGTEPASGPWQPQKAEEFGDWEAEQQAAEKRRKRRRNWVIAVALFIAVALILIIVMAVELTKLTDKGHNQVAMSTFNGTDTGSSDSSSTTGLAAVPRRA